MFGPLVLHRVGGEVHRTDVVAVDQRAPGEGRGAQQRAVGAKRPQPRRLRQRGTPPRHWSGAPLSRRK